MYGASPEKRRIIKEQVNKWLAMEVNEPLQSPWSAPVVIAYCNSKAHFCIDYCKINVVTIADKFPIPCQVDIMATLSGLKVLSSLNALSGFLQMHVHLDNIEKTAFQTVYPLTRRKYTPLLS
jgi:hypothetical protein